MIASKVATAMTVLLGGTGNDGWTEEMTMTDVDWRQRQRSLNGGPGNDVLSGGTANDISSVGAGNDRPRWR